MKYRNLQKNEIDILKNQGCSAGDWQQIIVKDGFSAKQIHNVRFDGSVKLGVFDQKLELFAGISKKSGLYNSSIRDCIIDDNVYISDVKILAGYKIQRYVVIENVANLCVSGNSSFGNGINITILNEGGGRELPIYEKLSSQIAYLLVMYRHDAVLVKKLGRLIENYAKSVLSGQGTIKQGAIILNCTKIQNVHIGENSTISGALLLEEGTIAGNGYDPVFIGEGVIAKKFIVLSGSKIDGSAILDNCFIGQGVRIGKQFSAENSAFFANSEGFHGEACSVFAGPYTVTHHKSTLLIAGLFSFYNAGSGSNQSNHMYKLGPVHQGILERGSKTGSFSYLMWPSRVGAFTGVIGKHYSNFDTSIFPFSYILESEGKSLLMPAKNLFTVGTWRDSAKWPTRDHRKDPNKLDLIIFDLFNPYTVGKMIKGIEILKCLDNQTPPDQLFVEYNGILIKRSKLKTGYQNYETAIGFYLGNEIIKRLENFSKITSWAVLKQRLKPNRRDGVGDWSDISGLLVPTKDFETFLSTIRNNKINSITHLEHGLKRCHDNYSESAWGWCIDLIEKKLGVVFNDLFTGHLVKLINDWKNNCFSLNKMVLKDAEKEFSSRSQLGYGIDGDSVIKNRDFESVRGSFDQNGFIKKFKEEILLVQKQADRLIGLLEKM